MGKVHGPSNTECNWLHCRQNRLELWKVQEVADVIGFVFIYDSLTKLLNLWTFSIV